MCFGGRAAIIIPDRLLEVKSMGLRELPEKLVCGVTAVFVFLIFAAAFRALLDAAADIWLWLLCFCALAAGAFLLSRRLPERLMLPLILLAALAFRLPLTFTPDEAQVSDFALLYDSAQRLAAGDVSVFSDSYFLYWGYQIPFVLYEAFVISLGGGVTALRMLNLAWMCGAVGLCFLLARLVGGARAGFMAGVLYALYPGAAGMASVLTNQHISLFFILLGVWLLLSRGPFSETGNTSSRLLWSALAGLSLAFGGLMRPEAILAAASALVTAICLLLSGSPGFRRLAPAMAVFVAAYILTWLTASALVSASGIAPGGISNNRPEWKFVLGLDTSSEGSYSEENAYILDIEDDGERRGAASAAIGASLKFCDELPAFFWHKLLKFWGAAEDTSFASGLPLSYEQLFFTERAAFLLAASLALSGCLFLLRRGAGAAGLMLMCLVSANFLCYLVIEVQPRYRLFIMPAVFALAAGYGHRKEKRV